MPERLPPFRDTQPLGGTSHTQPSARSADLNPRDPAPDDRPMDPDPLPGDARDAPIGTPRVSDKDRYPTLPQIGLLCLFVVAVVLLSSILVEMLVSERLGVRSVKSGLIGLMVSEALMLSGALLLLRIRRLSAWTVLRLRPVSPRVLLASFWTAASWSVLVGELDSLIQRFVPIPDFLSRVFTDLVMVRGLGDSVLVFLAVVLLPGICEEVFFRGVVLSGLARRWGSWAGIVTSSLLFALLHFNPWQLTPLFLVGGLLAYLVVATGSLYPAILAHSLNNLLSWVSMGQTGRVDYQMPLWLVGASAFLFLAGLSALRRALAASRGLDQPAI